MGQLFRDTAIVLQAGVPVTRCVASGKARGRTRGNVTLANNAAGATANITITYYSQKDGSGTDAVVPGAVLSSQDVWVDDVQIVADANATIALDIRFPDVLPPQNLRISGGTLNIAGTVNTDFGQSTVPSLLQANTAKSASSVATVAGTPMVVASIQDPPQESDSRPGKSIPVKTNA